MSEGRKGGKGEVEGDEVASGGSALVYQMGPPNATTVISTSTLHSARETPSEGPNLFPEHNEGKKRDYPGP